LPENTIKYSDINRIITYLKKSYSYIEDMPIIKKIDYITSKDLTKKDIKEFAKLVIQFLFMNNFTILKSRSPNSIRHIFPRTIESFDKFLEFYNLLKKLLQLVDIEIEIINRDNINDLRTNFSERDLYFYFQNFQSVFKFLLYWDDSLLKFPQSKMNDLKQFFKDFKVYIHFSEEYMNQIFGEKGIIKKKELTMTKYFDNVFDLSKYKRHSIYKWRDEKFLPTNVVIDINKSIYRNEIDIDYYKYIKYIKIGRMQKLDRALLDEIKVNYERNLDRFIPSPDSMLGNIFSDTSYQKEDFFDPLREFVEKYLKFLPSEVLKEYEKDIDKIKEKLKIPETLIFIKSIKLKNFKSYSNAKIEFQKGINILYGDNGSGKTSIIDGILFALYNDSHQKVHINDFYNLDLKFLTTQVIRVGEDACEVELELEKGNEIINIARKLNKNGKHKITINNVDLFESIREKVIQRFKEKALEIEKSPGYYFEDIEDIPRPVPIITPSFFADNDDSVMKESIKKLIEHKSSTFSYKLALDEYEGFFAYIEDIETEDIGIDDFKQFLENIEPYFSTYFDLINEEILLKYNEFGCFLNKNDIFTSLFQEFAYLIDISSSNFSKLHKFILDKFGVNFIEENILYKERELLRENQEKILDLIKLHYKTLIPNVDPDTIFNFYKSDEYLNKIISQFEPLFTIERFLEGIEKSDSERYRISMSKIKEVNNKIRFFENTKDFLQDLFSSQINKHLGRLSRAFFEEEKFYSSLDDKGIPQINYYEKNEILPLSSLSGGERSKLILVILGLLIKISNRNSFFLIDEPNELLDPNNVNNMKSLFSKLFERMQIVICTFIDSYKSFKPALVYYIEKENNISYITQIAPKEEINLDLKFETLMNRLYEIFEVNEGAALLRSNIVEILNLEENSNKKTINIIIDELIKERILFEPKPNYIKITDSKVIQKRINKG